MSHYHDPSPQRAPLKFPSQFLWGVSTSAFQIEGGWNADGKGPSIWDDFCRRPGVITDGSSGEVAADHYQRMDEDVALVSALGCRSYRFSISWPRVFPEGDNRINPQGMDFYDRLIDRLCDAGIEPMVTLYHWDLPSALQREGGWAKRSIVARFADYTEAVVRRIGDRVPRWITINEPVSIVGAGYLAGAHAPGVRNPMAAARVLHHLLLSHGAAVQRIRSLAPQAQVGIANSFSPVYPLHSRRDAHAADLVSSALNRLCMDPILLGHYPKRLNWLLRLLNRKIRPGDFDLMQEPIDFIGVNHYSRYIARRTLLPFIGFRLMRPSYENVLFTDFDWEIYPEGFFDVLTWIRDTYGNIPLIITENGAAFDDQLDDAAITARGGKANPDNPDVAGESVVVEDQRRVEFLREYLTALHRAMQNGVDVRGYFVWSLLDNFEWAHGYGKRFGLYSVDYQTGRRTPKRSALWYRSVCTTGMVTPS
jgi:beta-glucosidase